MNKILTAFVLCIMFVGYNQIAAQPSIFLDPNFSFVDEGDNVQVDITTNDFTAIQEFRFTLEYDEDVLLYTTETFNAALSASGGCSVTPLGTDPARLTIECILDADCNDNNDTDVTLNDGDLLVTLNFTAINGYTDITVIDDINDPNDHYVQRICNDIGLIIDEPSKVAVDNLPVTINIPDINANAGEQICVDFSLINFEDIISMQYTIAWDPTVLDYVNVDGFNLPGISSDNFNFLPGQDVLIFTWNDPTTSGTSVADGTSFTQICFNVVGDCNDVSAIEIQGLPTPVEITNFEDPGQDIGFLNGSGTVSVNCNNPDGLGVSINSPNSCINPGESFQVCAEVSNFVNLEEFSFSVNWNSNALLLDNVTYPSGLTAFGNPQSNQSLVAQGLLGFEWSDPSCSGVNLADGVDLFCLDFTSVGSGGVNSSIFISGDVDPINVTTQCGGSDNLGVNSSNGLVEICVPNGITIIASDYDVDPGDQICVPFTVQDFTDVESFSLSIAWDNQVLDYTNTINTALPGFSFDESFTQFGSLGLSWNGNGTPESLVDGSTLFEICFEAEGAPFSCSALTYTQFPNVQEVITSESGGFSVDVNAQEGEVCMVNPASLNIDISNANGFPGDTVCVDFTVSNFVSLDTVSFSVQWDPTVLEYVELINPENLPNFDETSYADNNAPNIGLLGVNWSSLSVFGNSLSNNTNIFSLCFNPIGGSGDCADIVITTNNLFPLNVVSAFGAGQNLGLNFNDGEICIGQFVSITDSIITPATCEGVDDGSITITPEGGSGSYNFSWSNNNGQVATTQNLDAAFNGNYTLEIQDANNPNLVASFEFTIGLDGSAPTADAGGDFGMPCDSPFATVNASNSSQGNFTYEWTDLGSSSNIFPTNILNPQVAGAGVFMLAVTDNVTGCTVTDTITVSPVILPASAVSFADQDTTLTCSITTVNLSSAGSNNFDNSDIQYIWTTDVGQVPAGSENLENISVTVPGTYFLEVYNSQSDCSSSASLVVDQNIVIPSVDAGQDTTLTCLNTSVILDGTSAGTDIGANFVNEWTDAAGTTISTNITTPEITTNGEYILIVTNTENSCIGSDTVIVSSDLDIPVVVLGPNLQLDCNNNSEVIIESTGSSVGPEFEYTWLKNGVDQMEPVTATTLTVTAADTYELQILNVNNNCSQSSVVIVSDSTALPDVPVLTSGTITCIDETTAITNSLENVNHYSFAWTGPNVDPATVGQAVPTVSEAGLYEVEITNDNTGCISIESINVVDDIITSVTNSLVTTTGESSTVITCENSRDTLILTLDSQDYNIVWNGPGIDATNEYQPVIDAAGTVFVTYENINNGCSDTLFFTSLEDLVDPVVTDIASSINEWGCDATSATLTVSTDISGSGDYEYDWAAIGCVDITVTNNGSTADVSGPCDFQVIVSNPTNGCEVNESITIEDIREIPDVDAGLDMNLNCDPANVVLMGTSETAGVNYIWTTANGNIVSDANTPNPTVDQVGVYTLTVVDPSNNCEAEEDAEVLEAILPTISAGSNVEFGCLDEAVSLNGSSANDVTYLWTGPCVESPDNPATNVNCPGIYTLMVEDINTGCEAQDSTEVILVYDIEFAEANFTGDPCVTEEIQLDGNIPLDGVTGQWVINPSTVLIEDPTEQSILLLDLDPGTYTASWTLSTDNCPEYSTSDVSFDVLSAPVANNDEMIIDDNTDFGQIDLLGNDDLLAGYNYVVTITDNPGVGEFLVSGSEVEYTPTPLLFDGQFDLTYEVCLEGCENLCSEALFSIFINRTVDANAEFPNTITPNGDLKNDEFVFDILSSSPGKYPDNNMTIFNRWGDIVFQAAPYANNWSGQNERGQDLPEGTYYYVLELDVANGIILNGSVTILR
jgi:gliding motility-associated-like protein